MVKRIKSLWQKEKGEHRQRAIEKTVRLARSPLEGQNQDFNMAEPYTERKRASLQPQAL